MSIGMSRVAVYLSNKHTQQQHSYGQNNIGFSTTWFKTRGATLTLRFSKFAWLPGYPYLIRIGCTRELDMARIPLKLLVNIGAVGVLGFRPLVTNWSVLDRWGSMGLKPWFTL